MRYNQSAVDHPIKPQAPTTAPSLRDIAARVSRETKLRFPTEPEALAVLLRIELLPTSNFERTPRFAITRSRKLIYDDTTTREEKRRAIALGCAFEALRRYGYVPSCLAASELARLFYQSPTTVTISRI
jgi:hypothetical protein